MKKQEILYGMSLKELNLILYKEIICTLQIASDKGYKESQIAMLINDAQVKKRLEILKERLHELLMSKQFIEMSKEENEIINAITSAIEFWNRFREN